MHLLKKINMIFKRQYNDSLKKKKKRVKGTVGYSRFRTVKITISEIYM